MIASGSGVELRQPGVGRHGRGKVRRHWRPRSLDPVAEDVDAGVLALGEAQFRLENEVNRY